MERAGAYGPNQPRAAWQGAMNQRLKQSGPPSDSNSADTQPTGVAADTAALSLSQRRGLIALLVIACVLLGVALLRNRATVADPQAGDGARHAELADKFDPNTADEAEIAAIPDVGQIKAHAIVKYREHFQSAYPGQRAFNQPADLGAVKGIGTGTIENMRPYLIFATR